MGLVSDLNRYCLGTTLQKYKLWTLGDEFFNK